MLCRASPRVRTLSSNVCYRCSRTSAGKAGSRCASRLRKENFSILVITKPVLSRPHPPMAPLGSPYPRMAGFHPLMPLTAREGWIETGPTSLQTKVV